MLVAASRRTYVHAEPRTVPAWWYGAKRLTDVTVASTLLLLALPVLLLAAVGIVLVSRGDPIFRQQRVGRDGRRFTIYKLRTMRNGAHLLHHRMRALNEVSGPVLKIRNDPRLHRLGAFLRRTSIDEIPNLINVLAGDMSMVGPRPPLPCEVENYDQHARRRLFVKPGVTCLWQISGRSTVSFEDWMDLDNRYVDTWSPLGDLRIILATIPAVLRCRGAC